MPFPVVVGAVPWGPILQYAPLLQYAPAIVSEARKLYEATRHRRGGAEPPSSSQVSSLADVSDALEELRARIDAMEAHDARQAELISQMAAQGEALSRGLQAVSERMRGLLWIAGSATVLAAAALVVAVLK